MLYSVEYKHRIHSNDFCYLYSYVTKNMGLKVDINILFNIMHTWFFTTKGRIV